MSSSPRAPFNRLVTLVKSNEKVHVAWCVTGIVTCLIMYGVLQERIMAEDFVSPDGTAESFTASLFIVMCNRLITCAVTMTMLWSSGQGILPQAPIWNYLAVSGSNVVATFCQYEALKHVSFPVQTLGKCAKMFPVMIWGTLVAGKRYKMQDYIMATLVTAGCVMFVLLGNIKSKKAHMENSSLFGIGLMASYLLADGFTSSWQDKMFRGFQMSIYNQILYVQACSAGVSIVSLLAFGQMAPAIAFLTRHPDCLWNIIVLSIAATVAQLFISYTIKTFGALLFATVMTTRQFLSILVSCFLFLHPLTWGQGLATAIVFGTLYYKNLSASRAIKVPEKGPVRGAPEAAAPLLREDARPIKVESTALERLVAASNKT